MGQVRKTAMGLAAALALCGQAAAQPAPAAPPDAERLALAQQIYTLVAGGSMAGMTRTMQQMMSQMMQGAGGGDDARAQAVRAAMTDSMGKMLPKVLQGSVQLMAADFTTDQLKDMLAFYHSPTGEAVVAKMPVIMQQSTRLSLSYLPQMMRDFEADYCARVTCTDKERAAFAQLQARFAAQPGAR